MFRTSLRSVSGPLHHYARPSSLSKPVTHRVQSRQFFNLLFGNAASGKASTQAPAEAKNPPEDASIAKDDNPTPESKPDTSQKPVKSDRPVTRGSTSGDGSVSQPDGDGAWAAPAKQNVQEPQGPGRKAGRSPRKSKTAMRKTERNVVKRTKGEALQRAAAQLSKKRGEPKETPPAKQPAKKSKPQKKSKDQRNKTTGRLKAKDKALTPLDVEMSPVPGLAYGLDRVLYNPGVYQLRDPRSRVFNFDPYLGSIMPVTEFDFESLKKYITSSKDDTLRDIAVKEGKKYAGSSSSMTSVLSHFHYLLSAWRPVDIRTMSQGFPEKMRSFTRLLRAPSAMFLLYQDGVYAVDADKEFENANILMNLGKSMEKLLTLPKEEFERYRRSSENKISPEEEQATPESYHYSTLGDFVMRSQLDAHDPRLPGTGMFDLKTRAVVSIRMDALNFEHGVGYEIKGRYGNFESYEREFFDMIRAAFLKYSLQVRIGRMDGIFVAFHNIERIFGFQYISLPEMDQTLHGQSDTTLGDREFQLSLELWNKILDQATAKYPKRSLRFHFETRDTTVPTMYVFAEPVTDDEIHAIQTKNRDKVEAYHRRILNLEPLEDERESEAQSESPVTASSETQTASTERLNEGAVNQEATSNQKTASNRETTSDEEAAPNQEATSTTVHDSRSPPDYEFISGLEEEILQEDKEDKREVLGLTVTIKNKVNGMFVERPEKLSPKDDWIVDYEITEMDPQQARTLYQMCQRRREKVVLGRGEDDSDTASNVYIRKLRELSKQGRKYRQQQDAMDREQGIVVLGERAVD